MPHHRLRALPALTQGSQAQSAEVSAYLATSKPKHSRIHSTPLPLLFLLFLEPASSFPSQGLCTCCPVCQEHSALRPSQGRLLRSQLSAQRSLLLSFEAFLAIRSLSILSPFCLLINAYHHPEFHTILFV